jgi:hypothetical protein
MISAVPAFAFAAAFAAAMLAAGDLGASSGKAGGGSGSGTGKGSGKDARKGPAAAAPPGPLTELPELPEAPAWSYGSDGEYLDCLRTGTGTGILKWATAAGDLDGASAWDALRGVLRAARGPDDPRVWSAASRSALALASSGTAGELAGAAALAAGAAEGLGRAARDGGGPGGPPPAGEEEFALKVLEASRARLARIPGRAGAPFPAPAYRLGSALFPVPEVHGPDAPGPAELRAALAEAERDDPGSRRSLIIRSRLGEAAADDEAWSRARATSLAPLRPEADGGQLASGAPPSLAAGTPSSGAAGRGTAEALLRSASEGLDDLLGRTHPDALDARERLARFLAGFPGPGIPQDPLSCERPPDADTDEAFRTFMDIAAARAASAAGNGDGDVPGKAAGPGRRGKPGAAPRDEREAGLRPGLASALENLRISEDEPALAAASAAAASSSTTPPGEDIFFLEKACEIAEDVLGPDHPATLGFMPLKALRRLLGNEFLEYYEILRDAAFRVRSRLGSSSLGSASAFFLVGQALSILLRRPGALGSYAEALEAFEDTAWGCGPSPWAAGRGRGLPPGRAGRDCLMARIAVARCISLHDPGTALGILGPFLDALPDLPPAPGEPGTPPWPLEIEGMALAIAGIAASDLGDPDRAEALLRRAVDALGPEPENSGYLKDALGSLSAILASRDDEASRNEAERLAKRFAYTSPLIFFTPARK